MKEREVRIDERTVILTKSKESDDVIREKFIEKQNHGANMRTKYNPRTDPIEKKKGKKR